ncbi:hypothetical protein [Sphingomonas sp.]|jgi:hypothetical protein|uniref:hypothetical protein n=1 Tax=Sphingomonas sp. TaxID=28214 RepID=UPI002E3612EF|nr:hypothetical protein [Sphingomonas sp.]HEX4694208.1 hypothetical protein [Sphingomonas sp.]
MANSFASLSTAIAWGSVIFALIGIVAGIAWGKIVTIQAENEARTEAKRAANELIKEWLSNQAPAIIRAHVELMGRTVLRGDEDDDAAADEIGKNAG